jgi:hypothetical protein
MTTADENTLAAILQHFPNHDPSPLLAIVNRYGTETYENEIARVRLAIIQLSAGDEEKLAYFVDIAKTDYRDVLAWQQLGPISEEEGQKLQAQAREIIAKWGKPSAE